MGVNFIYGFSFSNMHPPTDAAKIIRTSSFLSKDSQNIVFLRFSRYQNNHQVI
jgi:hypothetical protein